MTDDSSIKLTGEFNFQSSSDESDFLTIPQKRRLWLGIHTAFYHFENRRLERQLGGRMRKSNIGSVLIQCAFAFLLLQFLTAIMVSDHNSGTFRSFWNSTLLFFVLIIVTVIAIIIQIVSIYHSPEHVFARLGVLVLYLFAMWFTYSYDWDAGNKEFFVQDFDTDEWSLISVFIILESMLFIAYLLSNKVYPTIVCHWGKKGSLRPTRIWWRFRYLSMTCLNEQAATTQPTESGAGQCYNLRSSLNRTKKLNRYETMILGRNVTPFMRSSDVIGQQDLFGDTDTEHANSFCDAESVPVDDALVLEEGRVLGNKNASLDQQDTRQIMAVLSYKPHGWFWPTRRQLMFRGEVDFKTGVPNGICEWVDDSYNGECLAGYVENGKPIGPFRSRERGSGALLVSLRIGYCTSREEDNTSVFCFPKRGFAGLRFGTCSIESSAGGGGFYKFLPRVNHHWPTGSNVAQAIRHIRFGTELTKNADAIKDDCREEFSAEVLDSEFDYENLKQCCEENDSLILQEEAIPILSIKTSDSIKRHFVLRREVEKLGRNSRNSTLSKVEHKEALLFLHGYNCPVDFALCKLGQLLSLGSFPTNIVPFVFSQSTGRELCFFKAVGAIPIFASDCADFIRILIGQGFSKIHILAHSMGVRLFFYTFESLLETSSVKRVRSTSSILLDSPLEDQIEISNLILLNGDFPLGEFRDRWVCKLHQHVRQTTIYADKADGALAWAERFTHLESLGKNVRPIFSKYDLYLPDSPTRDVSETSSPSGTNIEKRDSNLVTYFQNRAKQNDNLIDSSPTYADFIDVIDTTDMDQNVHSLRHSYFNLNMQIVSDIAEIVRQEPKACRRIHSLVRKIDGQNVFTFQCPPSFVVAD